jgi:N-acetylmuramoyl-L-alanine amidase
VKIKYSSCALTMGAVALLAISALYSADAKRLAVLLPGGTVHLSVVELDAIEYVALQDVLERLGPVTSKIQRDAVRVRHAGAEAEFTVGAPRFRVGNEIIDVQAPFQLHGGKLMVPLNTLSAVLLPLTKEPVSFHRAGRRLFLGPAEQTVELEVRRAESALNLHFPIPVNPRVAAEGNAVILTFTREPIVMSSDGIEYQDSPIQSVTFVEKNGLAEIRVQGSSPLLASFSNGGRTVQITPAPAPDTAVATPPVPEPVGEPLAPEPPMDQPTPSQSAAPSTPSGPAFFVLIDAAHGGRETGVRFSDKMLEKEISLGLARRLKTELANRGIAAVLLRDSDETLSLDARAMAANERRAAIYISVHAGQMGTGVRIFTPLMPPADPAALPPFTPWQRAQAGSLARSRALASSIQTELTKKEIAAETLVASVPPLKSVVSPAVAIELAPQTRRSGTESLSFDRYQTAVAQAAAAGIIAARYRMAAAR